MYTAESILKVRQLDIVSVIGGFIKLDGHNKACCPFHNEKTPSFNINQRRGFFKCFGCGAGGDAIEFVKLTNKCQFIEAVETIADLHGIELERDVKIDAEKYKAAKAEQKSLREVLYLAHQQYRDQLAKNQKAIEYWNGRGYNADDMAAWQLGFVPLHVTLLTRLFTDQGLLPPAMKLGLIREKDNKLHQDVFINRVIIPILDEHGELVSFAGRRLEDGERNKEDGEKKYPKYINGYASPLYNKSRTLFGLYQAIPGIKRIGYACLTEGYTDVMSLHKAGMDNAIASCGTAFTEDMGKLLKRYTSHVVLMRDSDPAGDKAEDNDLAILLRLGFRVDIFPLPDKLDPDQYARKHFIEFNEEDLLQEEQEQLESSQS